MKVHSYTIIHYGKDYISYALQSVYNLVDQLHIIYTPHPSHGTQTNISPIETKEEIQNAIVSVYDPAHKIKFYEMSGIYDEGQQRNRALAHCLSAGAEMVLVLDYDEIWHESTLKASLDHVWELDTCRNWLINFTHLWKSFNYVCYDELWPVRIIDLRHKNGTGYLPKTFGETYHFGYAISDKVMQYKWEIHGHKAEMRQNWLNDKWSKWPPADDCHPTNEKGFWNPVEFDRAELPNFMAIHPWYDLEKID
jgi:hypothetical protein